MLRLLALQPTLMLLISPPLMLQLLKFALEMRLKMPTYQAVTLAISQLTALVLL